MSGFADFEKAVQTRMSEQWAAGAYPSLPVFYENYAHGMEAGDNSFIELILRDGEGERISIPPAAIDRYAGVIIAQIFVRPRFGARIARQYADAVSEIFKWMQFETGQSGRITCKTPSIIPLGEVDGWIQINVSIPFQRDKIDD